MHTMLYCKQEHSHDRIELALLACPESTKLFNYEVGWLVVVNASKVSCEFVKIQCGDYQPTVHQGIGPQSATLVLTLSYCLTAHC